MTRSEGGRNTTCGRSSRNFAVTPKQPRYFLLFTINRCGRVVVIAPECASPSRRPGRHRTRPVLTKRSRPPPSRRRTRVVRQEIEEDNTRDRPYSYVIEAGRSGHDRFVRCRDRSKSYGVNIGQAQLHTINIKKKVNRIMRKA
ncbi:hypothetical protein EVAR_38357_1 [Eumeta japonica]|uniref:Uncharacterized protein n=1 Tax=Eumeta variegata TaxID=151549 RepID=A0A4C1Y004_EUMVA|nr:hypothetical protein EVAR_38357_1 [Eumeta japonica]